MSDIGLKFLVTDDQMYDQLAEGSAFDRGHQVWLDPEVLIITEDGARSPYEVTWHLVWDEWRPVYNTCGVPTCIRLDHLTDSKAQAEAVKDEELMTLVQRSTVSLADLYRKGKARGLLSARTEYQSK